MIRMRLLVIASLTAAQVAAGQGTVADEGSFTVTRNGSRVGREDFSIRHVPTTAGAFETLTRGVVVLGAQRRTVDLSADSVGWPAKFQAKTIVGGATTETYRAEVLGRRLSARAVHSDGESARELILPAGTLLVEDGVMHLLGFVVARGGGASIPAMVPSRGLVVTLTVEDAGADRVAIALQSVEARKFIVHEAGGGASREVWVDRNGRLLKVVEPALNLVAVRDDAPQPSAR